MTSEIESHYFRKNKIKHQHSIVHLFVCLLFFFFFFGGGGVGGGGGGGGGDAWGDQKSHSGVVLGTVHLVLLSQDILLNLELSNYMRLAGSKARVLPVSTSPTWTIHLCFFFFFNTGSRGELRSFFLQGVELMTDHPSPLTSVLAVCFGPGPWSQVLCLK